MITQIFAEFTLGLVSMHTKLPNVHLILRTFLGQFGLVQVAVLLGAGVYEQVVLLNALKAHYRQIAFSSTSRKSPYLNAERSKVKTHLHLRTSIQTNWKVCFLETEGGQK